MYFSSDKYDKYRTRIIDEHVSENMPPSVSMAQNKINHASILFCAIDNDSIFAKTCLSIICVQYYLKTNKNEM